MTSKRKAPSPRVPRRTFKPVLLRRRHDGWTADKQYSFIEALAECGCVDEACARVGMGRTAAYALRTRSDSESFRIAWEAALGVAVSRLEDAFFGRTVNGVSRPIFYKGEQVGERRYYDERAAMFMLRYRAPTRYGAWRDQMISQRAPDGAAHLLAQAMDHMMKDAAADEVGVPRPLRAPLVLERTIDEQQWVPGMRARKRATRRGT